MTHNAPLLEVVREIYEQEKGIGFRADDTYIIWNNPDPAPETELGFRPLVLDNSEQNSFGFVEANVFLGWGGDIVRFDTRSLKQPDSYLDNFADRLWLAYNRHDHEVCLDGVAEVLARQKRTPTFTYRAHATGEVIKR